MTCRWWPGHPLFRDGAARVRAKKRVVESLGTLDWIPACPTVACLPHLCDIPAAAAARLASFPGLCGMGLRESTAQAIGTLPACPGENELEVLAAGVGG